MSVGRVCQHRYRDKATGEWKLTKTWYVRYYVNGEPRDESSGSTKKSDAVALLKKRLAEIGSGRYRGPAVERTTFDELETLIVTDYKINGRRSLERLETSLKHLREFFGPMRAIDITEDRIDAYKAARLAEGAAPASVNNELAALKRAFRLAFRAQKVARVPYIGMLAVNNIRKGFFEPDDYLKVRAHLPALLQRLADVYYITGWRRNEVRTLRWLRVDFNGGWLRLEPGTTKTGEGRQFPFTPELRCALEQQRQWVKGIERKQARLIPWVFVHPDGRPIKDFRKAWKNACDKSGCPGMLVHDFRRTAVRNLERAGVPRSAAMRMVGHKTESIYRRYAIVDEAMLKEAAVKLAAAQGKSSDEQAKNRGKPAARSSESLQISEENREDRERARGVLSPERLPVPPPRRRLNLSRRGERLPPLPERCAAAALTRVVEQEGGRLVRRAISGASAYAPIRPVAR